MSETETAAPPVRDESGDRTLLVVNYVLIMLGATTGLTVLIAAILAYVRQDTATPWLQNHFSYQIRTFWYWLAMVIVGVLTLWILIGVLILLFASIWLVVRGAVGLIRLIDGRPHPDPTTFLV